MPGWKPECGNPQCEAYHEETETFTLMTKAILGLMAKQNGGVLIIKMADLTPLYGKEDQVDMGYTSDGDLIFGWNEE